MSCQQKMILEPLSEEESWCLFTDTLGDYAGLSLEVQQTALLVAKECAGLPLGLVALAGSMRGVDDVREWRSVLEQLKDSRIRPPEMEERVFKVLSVSFDRLRDPELSECFLYCSIFPEDYQIPRERLIQYLVNDEIIKGRTNRKAQVDRVHALLNKLENVCLLQGILNEDSESFVQMHDLIRDMALRKSLKAMIDAGKQLRELPHASRWPRDLTRASFMYNNIKKIPRDYSPLCPELSSLSLSGNTKLRDVKNRFFKHMSGLKILDLSWTSISVLPNSVTNLPNLTALLLAGCKELWCLPSLASLRKLQELDLVGCSRLEQIPASLELLSNLRYLDLDGKYLKVLPIGLFSHNLANLEHLGLPFWLSLNERPACSRKLDYLRCRLPTPRDFFRMVTNDAERLSPSNYTLMIGLDRKDRASWEVMRRWEDRSGYKKQVLFYKCDVGEGGELIAAPSSGFDNMVFDSCYYLTSVDKFHCVDDGGEASQREVEFVDCYNLECLISPSCVPVPSNMVNHVLKLTLISLSNMRFLIHIAQPLLSSNVFSCLRVLRMFGCHIIQSLFLFELLTNLRNLEEINVQHCNEIEEIIAASEIEVAADPSLLVGEAGNSSSYGRNESAEFISLPKLKVFKLVDLPQLKRICSKKMSCVSLEKIVLQGCPMLERIPFSLVQLDDGRPSPLPSLKKIKICEEEQEWWDSVEFDSRFPDPKYVLEPLLVRKLSD